MKARSRHTLAAAVMLLLAGAAAARAGSGGSTYSLLGLGDIRYAPGARSEGMGLAGLALLSPAYIDPLSPASWSRIDRVRLEGSAFYEGFNSTDGVTSRYLARMDFHGVQLAVPVSPASGIVIVGGFTPYSDVNYDTYTSAVVASQGVDPVTGLHDTLGYTVHQAGTGGVTRSEIGASWAPLRELSVGASFNYLFGTLTHNATQVPLTAGTTGGTFSQQTSVSGLSFTVGAIVTDLGAISEALRPFSLGFALTTRTNLHTTFQTVYDYTSTTTALDLQDTSSQAYGRIAVPYTYSVGAAYQPSKRWTIAADFTAQPWSQADFNGSSPYGLRNSSLFGIGAERAASTERTAGTLDRMAYRLGFTYAATYYAVNGQRINEWGVTAGLAFPLSGESDVNLAAMYGGRGTIAGDLVKDRIFRLTVALHFTDVIPWFVQTPEE